MAQAPRFSLDYREKRGRKAYDINARIRDKDAKNPTGSIRTVHLSRSELRKHLSFLIAHGLIVFGKDGKRGIYRATEKGRQYFDVCGNLISALDIRPE